MKIYNTNDCIDITECQARLDVNNHEMWKAAGLELDQSGGIIPHGDMPEERYGNDNHSREDMYANALILLLSKLNNYVVSGESLFPTPAGFEGQTHEEFMEGVDHLGISQQTLLERWTKISLEFEKWHENLPDTFRPSARLPHPVFSEIWYSIPMCASACQNYHMAKILLLINKPHETTARRTTIASRMKSYQSITEEINNHPREISGIDLSRTACSVRIFSIQPLFVAGSCFTERREQEIVLDLLQGIEKELGWKTDYRCEKLLQEWKWE